VTRTFADWLALREPADGAARAADLVDGVRAALEPGPLVIHDLGSGTGSMGRWLAPRLPRPQHWVMYDRDPSLLGIAAGAAPPDATVETRQRDITRLPPGDLAGASLITASALLDMFSAEELDRFVAGCVAAGCPALLTLSVTGQVTLTPADPLDAEVEAAFNDHQRRTVGDRTLLGPDAAEAAVAAFGRHGKSVLTRDTPWRLGAGQADLIAAWLDGWIGAACEQRPDLAGPLGPYAERRLAQARAGELSVQVGHMDLLAGADVSS
jgi:hypothetical protein